VAVFSAASGATTTLAALTLARALSRDSRVVLVDLAPGNPNLAAISSDPRAPGIADVIRGTTTFAGIITKDKLSRLQLVSGGVVAGGSVANVLALPEFTAAVEALARSYDFFIIDAGTAPDALIARVAEVAPRAVLVAPNGSDRGLQAAYDHFMAAGFTDVAVATGMSAPTPSSPAPVRAAVA
jgi:succinoglycan biosynthesis transport protein ExoP